MTQKGFEMNLCSFIVIINDAFDFSLRWPARISDNLDSDIKKLPNGGKTLFYLKS